MFSFLFLYMKTLNQHINEKLQLSRNRNRFVNDDEKFVYNKKAMLFNNCFEFIFEYYLKRVKIDDYTELEDIDKFKVFFVDNKIYYQRKGQITRYLMTEVKDGETFREVYDRIIDYLKEENIIVQ